MMGWKLDVAYACGLAATLPLWATRLIRTGKWRTDWRGRFGAVPAGAGPDGRPAILIHAVSVGEVNAAEPLVRRLAESGAVRVVVSSTTNTGVRRAEGLFAPDVPVVRFPLDFSRSTDRFLGAIAPDAVGLVELELWPNLLEAAERRGIPVAVVNGRLSRRSFDRMRRIRGAFAPMFRRLAGADVQSTTYRDRFAAMGTPPERIRVTDTMKWDAAETEPPAGTEELGAALGLDGERPVVVAGSTGPGEESMLLEAAPAGTQLVIAPRKPERFESVAALDPRMRRRSACPDGGRPGAHGPGIFLLDTVGELKKAYALADVAVVGRSFLGLHGSNPLESVALGCPTVIGPHHEDFAELVAALTSVGGLAVAAEPGAVVADWLRDREATRRWGAVGRAAVRARQGAADAHADRLLRLAGAGGAEPAATGRPVYAASDR